MAKDMFDAVYGSLIAGAIGDALGAPVEGMYYSDIRDQFGRVDRLMASAKKNTGPNYGKASDPGEPGLVTDDTTLRHYLCLAIVQKGGRVTPDDVAEVWINHMNPNRLWTNEKIVLHKLKCGMNPWDSGKGTPPAGCASMAISPIGIINAGDPAQAYQDGFNIAFVNQDNENRDGAATIAAAVAGAFIPGADERSIIDVMMKHSSYVYKRALELTLDLAAKNASIEAFCEEYYTTMLDWTWPRRRWNKERFFSGSSLEIVPLVAAVLYYCKTDVNECLVHGVGVGRDNDTISAIVGTIAGAVAGASAIRRDWIDTVEQANRPFFEELEGDPDAGFRSMAKRLVKCLEQEQARLQGRAAFLEEILNTRST